MPWTPKQQAETERILADFERSYDGAYDEYVTALQSGAGAVAAKGKAESIISSWWSKVQDLQAQSDLMSSQQNSLDTLGQLATQITEERTALKELRSEANTRGYQSDSVNPKITGSPYTNILGLRRSFRETTRMAILVMSIIFGVIALALLAVVVFKVASPMISVGGGGRSTVSASHKGNGRLS
jgi:hypothetical protein